jgi:acyl-CoA reductase-like NAD-dependent aldehyde dehydrogenase
MNLMMEESFGPVLGIMRVKSDEEALGLMNDSPYGLTAALFTSSHDRAVRLTPQIETGTVFMNRCDYLDPELAWTGVKDTGFGVSLSQFGFGSYYRLKSWHHKLVL